MTKQYILWTCLMGLFAYSHAQHVFQITGGKVKIQSRTHLVLNNTSWGNSGGELLGDSGVVHFKGIQSDTIGGNTATTFGQLYLDKNGASVELRQMAQVKDSLDLAAGKLKLEDQNLRMLSGSGASEGSAGSYVQSSGTGQLQAEVGSGNVLFPIGGSSYRPAILQNNGSLDFFGLRVTDSVLTQGNQGSKISQEALAASWFVEEENPGGSSLDLSLQWNGSDEQTGFDRANAYISSYSSSWDVQPAGPASGSDPYQISRANLGGGGVFAIFSSDTEDPVISCPTNIVQGNDPGDCGAVVTYAAPVGTDNSVNPTTSLSSGLGSGAFFPLGTRTEVYTVTDASGNTASCSFSVTINDTQAPALNCPQPIVQGNDPGSCDAVVSYAVTASDNCPGESISQLSGQASGSTYAVGSSVNHTFLVTDAAGNTASCAFSVTVNDTEHPDIVCPSNIVQSNEPGSCDAVVTYAVTASDNCPGESISQQAGLASGSRFAIGNVVTNSFTATDASGNTASCAFTVTVSDTELPQVTCPQNITQSNDAGVCGALVTYTVSSSDNCSGESLNQSSGLPSGSLFPLGTTTNSFTVTDASGNTASCSFTVTVNDTEAPVANCPGNMQVNNDPGICGAAVTYLVTSSDNCSGEILQQTAGLASGQTFSPGITTNRFTVTDASGNTASCSFTVEVIDNTGPGISCPSTILQTNDLGVCGAMVTYSVSSSDNCQGESISQTAGLPSGSTFPVGTTTNSFTVTDVSGNTAECSFDVTITDDENPVISCPPSVSLANDPGQCGRVVTYLTPQGTDNCNSSTALTAGLGSGSTFPFGVNTETYTVTDASGNSANCSFSITITDGEKPVINLLGANPLILCVGDTYVEAGATATDNCDGTVSQNISINNSAVNTAQEGTYYVTYDVTDANGNSAIQLTRTVIVNRSPNQLAQQNCGSCGQIRFTFCQDEPTQDLESLLLGNANYLAGATFNWYADNSGSQGGAIAKPTVNTASPSTHFYWVSQQIGSCEGLARRVRVRVKKASLVVFDLPNAGCGTTSVNLAAHVSDSRNFARGYEFWQGNPSQGGSYLGSVTATRGQVDFGQIMNISLPGQPTTYYATAITNTGCQTGASDVISSASGPSLAPIASQTVSSGDLVSVSFSAPGADRIVWYNLNNPSIGILGVVGSGPLGFTAFNSGSSPLTAQLFAIAYQGGCASQMQSFSITVNPGANTRQGRGNSLELAASKLNAHDVQLSWDLVYEYELVKFVVEKKRENSKDVENVMNGSYSPPLSGHVRLEGGAGGGSGVTSDELRVTSDDWEEIGEISWEGDGHYDFVDRGGMSNVTKYRLKLIHADDRAIWSEEVEVTFDYLDSEHFQLYPNPSGGRFSLRAPGPLQGEWGYKLSDGLGRTLLTGKLKGRETAFDISSQPGGYYYLVITSPEGKRYLRKVVKR